MQNVINGIFATVTTIQEGVEILEVFSDMGSREVRPFFSPSLPHSLPPSLPPSLTSPPPSCTSLSLLLIPSNSPPYLPLSSSLLSSFTPSILLFPILPPPSFPPSLHHTHTYTHTCIYMYITQTIKRVIDKQTVELFSMFNKELNLVKKEFSHHSPQLPRSQPRSASVATWARLLKRRIDLPMKVRRNTLRTEESVLISEVS